MHVAAQWPFLQADYPSQSLCYIKKRGKNRAPKKRKGGLYSSNQCCPLCCLTFEGLVINDCWLLYLNVSPQLPGTALIGSGTCWWPQLILRPPNSPMCFAVRAGRPLSLWCWHVCSHPQEGREDNCPRCPPPCQLFLCLLKGEGRKKDKQGQNIKKKRKKREKGKMKGRNLGWGRDVSRKGKLALFCLFVCPATTLSSAVLAEIAFCALAFPLLLHCRKMIRIIYCLAATLSLSVGNASL